MPRADPSQNNWPSVFFVPGDAVLFDQGEEILWRVARQGGPAEMRVFGKETIRRAVQVGEIAASAAGDEDFFAGAFGVVEHHHAAAALAGGECAHQAGGAGAQYDYVGHRQGQGLCPWTLSKASL